ncbi:MAG: hypothetical protein Q8K30_01445 [Candidatus Gracilibacteria bacterium]|nr:hypothetical protein [Candidatus Gracilibacteria bacterium]
MAINGNNNVNENSEIPNNTSEDLKSKFIKQFVSEKISEDKITFINDIMNNNTLASVTNLDSDMNRFKSMNNDFKNFKLEDISIFDLKRAIGKDYLKVKNARNNLLGIISQEYDYNNSEKDKISKKIDTLTIEELYSLINSDKKINVFLEKIINNIKLRNKKNTFNFLNGFSESEINNRLDKYGIDKRKQVEGILYDISTLRIIDNDIRILFELNFFNDSEKKELVEKFIPTIDLQKASDIGILTKSDATKLKEKLIKSNLLSEGLTDLQINSIIENTPLSDITLLSKDFFAYNNSIDKLATEIGFKNLENDFKDILSDINTDIQKSGPQNFQELLKSINDLNKNNNFKNIDKFKKGNIFTYTTKDIQGDSKTTYFQISSIDDNSKTLGIKLLGDGNKIITNYESVETQKLTYKDFLTKITNTKELFLDFFSPEQIENKISSTDDKLTEFDYKRLDTTDLQKNKASLTKQYIDGLNKEINDLKNEFSTKKDDKQLESLIKQKEEIIKNYNNNQSDENLLELINFKKFIDKIDEIDSDGKKLGFEKGTIFESKNSIYEVIGISDNYIDLKSLAGKEKITYEVFYDLFSKNKAKRKAPINNFGDYINQIKSKGNDFNKKWDKHEIINGELIEKSVQYLEKTEDKKVEFLVSSDNNELIKINKISGNSVTVQFGERKDYSDYSKGERKKNNIPTNAKGEKISLEEKEYNLTLSELDLYINKFKFYPNWKTGQTIEPDIIKDKQNKFENGFFTSFFNRVSINEIISGGKMLVEGIKETLKKGNDLHAAKFASGLGGFLPDEIKQDMLIKVERAESEQMDKELDSLSKVDSPIAVQRIEKWLLNKSTPEYKKEAGILFMLEKYGHLASKGALFEYRGKRLWYEALGGRINDKLFIETKEEAEKSNITFSEEYLVHLLLKKQCSKKLPPYRRSRLHKEYENKWKSGVEGELEKGYKDASNKRTAKDMLKSGFDEASGGTSSNSIGWFKKSIERGGTLEDMSEGFFCLIFSGSLYNIDQTTFNKIKTLWDGDGMPMIIARMSSTYSDMILFNKLIIELSEKITVAYGGKYSSMGKEAKELFNDGLEKKGLEKDRLERSREFWKKYSTPLVRAINIANTDNGVFSKTDKIILFEKDKNPIFKEYYSKIRSFSDEIEFKEEFMTDGFKEQGVTGLCPYQVARKTLKMHQSGGFIKDKNGKATWDEFSKDINSVKNKIFDNNSDKIDSSKNIELQKKYLLIILRDIIRAFIENSGGNPKMLEAHNLLTTDIGQDLNKWGIDLKRDFGDKSPTMISNGEADNDILKAAEKILAGGISNTNINFNNPFNDIQNNSKKAIDNTIGETNDYFN